MASLLPYAGAVVLLVAFWAGLFAWMDAFTPNDVRAWRRLAALRGYATPRGRLEKLASGSSLIRRLQDELDLARFLAIAGKNASPLGFLARAVLLGGVTTAGCLAIDVFVHARSGEWLFGLPPVAAFGVGILTILAVITDLRSKVKKRRENASKALGDMMMLVSIMTDSRGLQLEDAVRILSRCVDTNDLEYIVDRRAYRQIIKTPHHNTVELYRLISEAYDMPVFSMVADAAANANVGLGERDTFTRLSKTIYQQRLAEAKMRAARAKILVTLPVAGMLIPLLLLIGAPAASAITSGLGSS